MKRSSVAPQTGRKGQRPNVADGIAAEVQQLHRQRVGPQGTGEDGGLFVPNILPHHPDAAGEETVVEHGGEARGEGGKGGARRAAEALHQLHARRPAADGTVAVLAQVGGCVSRRRGE